jgi:broad specificity phosphatase PhoE
MSTEVLLIRHGESSGNRDRTFGGHGPSGLTELGRRQAEAAARAISARPVDAIFTSDLPRAVETASALARLVGREPIPSAALRERDVGEWTGLTFEEVQSRWPELWQALLSRDPDFRAPGGESHRDCLRRVGAFLEELRAHPPARAVEVTDSARVRVAVYSHGVAINHMLRHLIGLGADGHNFFFQVENCSVQRFEYRDDGGLRIFTVNDTAHLAGLESEPLPATLARE